MAVNLPIYMDNHATTPVDPRVLEAMLPYFTQKFGNAASRNHAFGWAGEEAVETARQQIASLINATPKEIIFTSGATESDNLMIKGIAEMYREKGNHIITQAIEHKAVLDTCKRLEKYGYEVTYLPVGKDGRVDPEDVRKAITPKTILITIMYANNEIGVVNPIAEIGKIAKEHGIFFAVDGVQAVGKIPVDVQKDNIDLLAITGHKIYGPKGVGALYVRRRNPRVQLSAIADGGGHERGMRSGTLNVPGIVGLGKACEICQKEMAEESVRMRALRDRLQSRPGSQARRSFHQWLHGASPAQQSQHELRLRRRRIAAHGHQRYCGFQRFGLHFGNPRAQLRTQSIRRRRRPGAYVDPLWPRPLQYRRKKSTTSSTRWCRSSPNSVSCPRCTKWPRKVSTSPK